MQVINNKQSGLVHSCDVTIPASDISSLVEKELLNLGKNAKIKGFRKGKAPVEKLRNQYGYEAFSQALDETIGKTVEKIIADHKLLPAVKPEIIIKGQIEQDKDIELSVNIQVLPQIKLNDIKKLQATKYKADIAQTDVEKELNDFARHFGTHKQNSKLSRGIKENDVIECDITVYAGSRELTERSQKNAVVAIGFQYYSGTPIPAELQKLLVGKKIDDTVSYGFAGPKGTSYSYEIKITSLCDFTPAKIDDELATKLQTKDLASLKISMKSMLENRYEGDSFWLFKRAVLDELNKNNNQFELPNVLVEEEFTQLWHGFEHEYKSASPEEQKEVNKDNERKEYMIIAQRRVRLGLVIGQMSKDCGIHVSQKELDTRLRELLTNDFRGDKEQWQKFIKNKGNIERVNADILEGKIVQYIEKNATVKIEKLSIDKFKKKMDDLIDHVSA